MLRNLIIVPLVVVAACCGFLTGPTSAQPKKVQPIEQFKGSVSDLGLQEKAPKNYAITSEKELADVWKAWEPEKKLPKVDFMNQLVLVATTRGSVLNLSASLEVKEDKDDKEKKINNLKVFALSTKDLKEGFRYQIVIIPNPKSEIHSVNDVFLPGKNK